MTLLMLMCCGRSLLIRYGMSLTSTFPTFKRYQTVNRLIKSKIYPCHIKKLLNQKLHLWRLFKRTGYEHHKAKFQDINKCIAAINKFHSDNESELINNGNLGSFFKYINSKTSYKSGVGPLKDLCGNLNNSDTDEAQLLNDQFVTVFVQDDGRFHHFQNMRLIFSLK